MSILDHNQQYEAVGDPSDEDVGKLFWFSGSMRLNKNKKGRVIVTEDLLSEQSDQAVESKPPENGLEHINHTLEEDHSRDFDNAGTYFKLNGSFGDSDLSHSDDGEGSHVHTEDRNGVDGGEEGEVGTWFGLSGRRKRAESMENLLDIDKSETEREISNEELDNLDAQFKAIEQLVFESFDQIDFGVPEMSQKEEKPHRFFDNQSKLSDEESRREFNRKTPQNIDINYPKDGADKEAKKLSDKNRDENLAGLKRPPENVPDKENKEVLSSKTNQNEISLHTKKKNKVLLGAAKEDTAWKTKQRTTKTDKVQNAKSNELQSKAHEVKNQKHNTTNKKPKSKDGELEETQGKTRHAKRSHHDNKNNSTPRDKGRIKKTYVRTNSSGIVKSRTEEFEKISSKDGTKDAPASTDVTVKISKRPNRDKVKTKSANKKRIDSNETAGKIAHSGTVSEDNIEQIHVEDNYAMNDIDLEFINSYLSESEQKQTPGTSPLARPIQGDLPKQDENNHATIKTESSAEPPRALLKRQMNATSSVNSSMDETNIDVDYATTDDEDSNSKSLKRGTSFRRSIVIEDDEVGSADKRKQSTGGTCVSVAFMAVNLSSNQEESTKKDTNQQLKGVLNFLENMALDEESVGLYYDAVRILHTIFWDLKDEKKSQKTSSNESLSTVLNFLVVHEWPKVMLSCFKKLKASFPNVFMEEPDAESTIYYSGHLPSLLRMNRTTAEFGIAVIFDGLLKAAVNFTDVHEASRQACCEDNLISYLLEDIMPQLYNIKWGKSTAREMFLKSICDLVYNCAQSYSNAPHLLEHNCVDTFTMMRDQTFHVVDARKVNMAMLLTLSFLIDDNNYDLIVPNEDFVIRVLQFLDRSLEHSEHTYHDFYAAELVGCLSRLAAHASIKLMITRNSGQEILHKLLKYAYDDDERIAACHALWNLAFCNEAKDILRGMSKLLNHLRELTTSSNSVLQEAASGVIWECEEKYDIRGTRKVGTFSSLKHIMISYEMEVQPLVIGVRDELNRQGYQVWMRNENDGRTLQEAMTMGVEKASVVIVAVTRKYKMTPQAFAEVDYAHTLRKTIVPVIVDVDYVPDGWLKDIIQTERTFDFSRRSMFGGSLDALVGHIKFLLSPDALQPQTGVLLNVGSEKTENVDVLSWSNADVVYWLNENQLIKTLNNTERLNKLTGLHLLMFFDLKRESPDYYYSVLDSHLGFKDVLDTLEFTYALDRLLGNERLI